MVLTHHHHQQQQQHLSHLNRVGIVFQKYKVRFQKSQEWENPRENLIELSTKVIQGYGQVTLLKKTPKSRGFGGWGLNSHFTPTNIGHFGGGTHKSRELHMGNVMSYNTYIAPQAATAAAAALFCHRLREYCL